MNPATILDALTGFVRAVVREELRAGQPARAYSQRDGERPPGAGKAKFLRVWRLAAAAGDVEATREGKARLLTAACWARHVSRLETRRTRSAPRKSSPSIDDQLLAELGARRAS